MVIFNSYVKLPEGICNDLWMFSLEIHASQLVAPSHRTSRRGSAQRGVSGGALWFLISHVQIITQLYISIAQEVGI